MDPHSRAPKNNTSHGNEVHHNILHISNKDHVTNQEVHAKIQQAMEKGKLEKTGCEIIFGAPTTLAIK